jgi:hypothetical protein
MLLIKFMRFKAAIAWSLSNLVAFLRWNLFTFRHRVSGACLRWRLSGTHGY